MKRLTVFLLLVACCWVGMLAMGIGSARTLTGKIYVLCVYVASADNDWTPAEKHEINEKVLEAEKWLTAQAARYGSRVSFRNGYYGAQNTIILPSLPDASGSGKEPVTFGFETMQKIGWKEPAKFVDWAKNNTGCDQVVTIFFARKRGRGYAMAYTQGYTKTFLESALLFSNYQNGSKLYAASIAHEMLHCFGAWDLYETFEQSAQHAAWATQFYPDDIMRRIAYNINDLNIGPLTAWRIGIAPEKEHYRMYEPGK